MKVGFIVGHTEQHEIELSFDRTSREFRILIDGTPVYRASPNLAKEPMRHYELSIGDHEKHVLAVQLAFGDEPELRSTPRLSLAVTPLATPASVELNVTDDFLAATAPARA